MNYSFLPKLVIVLGILIAIYPWISDYMYRDRMSNVILEYEKDIAKTNKRGLENLRKTAEAYNKDLTKQAVTLTDPFKEDTARNVLYKKYKSSELPIKEGELVGFIDIPRIGVYLPIYYGTDSSVLQSGIGQLKGSSLPVEGKSVHSVLTGHTGLNDKKLFTDLDQLVKGDLFFVSAFGKKLCFKVKAIEVVLPDNLEALYIKEGEDLCTLVTCTPYGINSHRLLVTGTITEYSESMEKEQTRGKYISNWKKEYMICVVIGLLMAITLGFIIKKRRQNAKKKEKSN